MITIFNAETVLESVNSFILFSGATHSEIIKAIHTKVECLGVLATQSYPIEICHQYQDMLADYKQSVGL